MFGKNLNIPIPPKTMDGLGDWTNQLDKLINEEMPKLDVNVIKSILEPLHRVKDEQFETSVKEAYKTITTYFKENNKNSWGLMITSTIKHVIWSINIAIWSNFVTELLMKQFFPV